MTSWTKRVIKVLHSNENTNCSNNNLKPVKFNTLILVNLKLKISLKHNRVLENLNIYQ